MCLSTYATQRGQTTWNNNYKQTVAHRFNCSIKFMLSGSNKQMRVDWIGLMREIQDRFSTFAGLSSAAQLFRVAYPISNSSQSSDNDQVEILGGGPRANRVRQWSNPTTVSVDEMKSRQYNEVSEMKLNYCETFTTNCHLISKVLPYFFVS